ncbi:hypothetical protein [Streptomyces sp. NPDC003996]
MAQRTPAEATLDDARRDPEGAAVAEHPWLSPFDAAALASESALSIATSCEVPFQCQ